ncbi:MAG: hypothetical protein RIS64_2834, partial [Bacteroidota bacterium]
LFLRLSKRLHPPLNALQKNSPTFLRCLPDAVGLVVALKQALMCLSHFRHHNNAMLKHSTIEQSDGTSCCDNNNEAPIYSALWLSKINLFGGVSLSEKAVVFFRRVKAFTIIAYFTSEKIGKEHLVYDPVPGPFIACMPLNGQLAWSGE